jgi:hypothetical protein
MQATEDHMQILSRSILEAHGSKSVSELQEECRYRGISDTGDKTALMSRLWNIHEQCWGPEGRKRDYERRLKVHRKKRLAEIVPFVWFNRFPRDIRLIIWEYSLPGPRTICPCCQTFSSSLGLHANGPPQRDDMGQKLHFPKSHHTPNPAALEVCRESRDVALTRYRLCFASTNIYADLDIDILFFGPWQHLHWDYLSLRDTMNWLGSFDDKELHPEVKSDLDRVQRIGIKYHAGWTNYYQGHHRGMGGDTGFLRLRKDLSKFRGLKEVLLSVNREDWEDYSEPGQTILEFRGEENQPELTRLTSGGRPQYDPSDLYYKDREAILLSSWYKKETFTPEEKERGVPKIKFVVVKRIPNVPPFKINRNMDDWEGKGAIDEDDLM